MAKGNVVVSTIGNFAKNYEWVNYGLSEHSLEHVERSRFSSAALAKMSGAKMMIVFAPVSLACNYISLDEHRTLNEIVEELKINVLNFLANETGEGVELRVVVTPTKGTFSIGQSGKDTLEIRSGSGNFYATVYQSIMEIFEDYGGCDVLVDVSHSVNYMALDMVDATNLALRSINASTPNRPGFKFKVYNSDPFIKGASSLLQLNLIRTEPIVERSRSISKIAGDLYYNFDKNYYRRAISGAGLDKIVDTQKLRKLVYSFLLGALLLVGSYKDDIDRWKKEIWRSMYNMRNILASNQILDLSDNILDLGVVLEREIPRVHAFLSSVSSNEFLALDKNTDIERLKLAARLLVEPGKSFLLDELKNIERQISNMMQDKKKGKMKLRKLYRDKYPEEENNSVMECKMNRRNFIAHAGLEGNITWITFEGNKVLLGYDKCLKEILSGIGKGI